MAGRRRRAQWLIAVLLFGLVQVAVGGAPPPPVSEPDDDGGRPSVDLLLFLAEFDDSDGEVIDRAELSAAQQRDATPKPAVEDDDD